MWRSFYHSKTDSFLDHSSRPLLSTYNSHRGAGVPVGNRRKGNRMKSFTAHRAVGSCWMMVAEELIYVMISRCYVSSPPSYCIFSSWVKKPTQTRTPDQTETHSD